MTGRHQRNIRYWLAVSFVLSAAVFALVQTRVQAAAGINQAVPFQGKVVNSNGTNVTDGTYDFVFKFYDSAASGATNLYTESWTAAALWGGTMSAAPASGGESLTYSSDTNESTIKVGQVLTNTTKAESVVVVAVNTGTNVITISPTRQAWATSDTVTNKIYVKDGIFQVNLNTLNVSFTGVDFNTDNIFLGINFNGDGEMKPRVQYAAVPYAMNALKVSGLTVSNTTGTFTLTNGKTLSVSNTLTFAGTDGTTMTFPSSSDTVVGLAVTQTLTNKTLTSPTIQGTVGAGTGLTMPAFTTNGNVTFVDTTNQSGSSIAARKNGNSIEFGHANTNGYGSTLGAENSSGKPFLAFNAEAGTTANTYRTRGIAGVVIQTDAAGALVIGQATTASADNQTLTSRVNMSVNGKLDANSVLTTPGTWANNEKGNLHLNDTTTGVDSFTKLTFGNQYSSGQVGANAGIGAKFTSSGSHLYLGTSNAYTGMTNNALVIDHVGLVGISTTAPNDLLHIEDTAATVSGTQLTLEGRFGGYGAGLDFVSRTSSGGTRLSMAKITADGENSWNTTASLQDAGLRFFTTLDGTQAEKLRIDANGNVGVGTTAPVDFISAGTGLAVGGSGARNGISIRGNQAGADGAFADYGFWNNGNRVGIIQGNRDGADNSGAMLFYTSNAGNIGERLRIDKAGNVGINTTAPSRLLDVKGILALEPSNSTNEWIVYTHTDNTLRINYNGAGDDELLIDSSGNVGIGTTAPNDLLHIEDTAATASGTQLTLEGRFGGYGAGLDFVSRTSSGGTRLSMAKITADGENSWNTTASLQDAGLRFFTTLDGTQAEKLRIDANGNVGIGTTAPGSKLDVKGTLRLSGSSSGYVGLAPAAAAGSTTYTLPAADGTNGQALTTNGSATLSWATVVDNTTANGRLTLTSATPVTTSDVAAATTVYYTPYQGNRIALYDGTNWQMFTFSELSFSVPATTNTVYDVWAYNNSGTVALETTAWTSDTTRATEIALVNGVYVKSGTSTRRYLGTFRTTGTSGQTEDSATTRFVWNYDNRVNRLLDRYIAGSSNYTTASWRQWNGNSNAKVEFITGVREDTITATLGGAAYGGGGYLSLGLNSTTGTTPSLRNNDASYHEASVSRSFLPPAGYYIIYATEYGASGFTADNITLTTWVRG